MLWIALFMPELPLQLAERAQPTPTACVIADGPALRPLVHCANAAARTEGVNAGMPVAAARALASQLIVLQRDENAETQALHNIACWACQFTPSVCVQPAQGLLLEVGSTLLMHGGLSRLLVRIGKGLVELGYHASPGIAPTPLAAWLLAKARALGMRTRTCRETQLLPERLATLPLALLDWRTDTLQTLQGLGINTIGQCLRLPRDGFIKRFGAERRLDLDKSIGSAADPRHWFTPPDTFANRIEFGFELNDTTMLLFPLKRLLRELEGFLRARSAGVQQWQLLLDHMNHGHSCIVISVAAPERSLERFLLLAREKLAQLQLSAPVLALGIAADKLQEFSEHTQGLVPDTQSRAIGWNHLIDRLVTRLGNHKVYRLRAVDDHRPERAWQSRVATAGKQTSAAMPALPRPLWLLRTPRSLLCDNDTPLYQGRLQLMAGPERIESGWWDGEPARRDYYVARNPHGETVWIYREHQRHSRWYLHGVFA